MDLQTNIIPITQARNNLGNLAEKAIADNYFILTKGIKPPVALVDLSYLKGLEEIVKKIYQTTFIDPKFDKYTRIFTNQEINTWVKEDQL